MSQSHAPATRNGVWVRFRLDGEYFVGQVVDTWTHDGRNACAIYSPQGRFTGIPEPALEALTPGMPQAATARRIMTRRINRLRALSDYSDMARLLAEALDADEALRDQLRR